MPKQIIICILLFLWIFHEFPSVKAYKIFTEHHIQRNTNHDFKHETRMGL